MLAGQRQNRSMDDLLKLLFNHFACDAVVRDLPDLAFRVAEHLLGLDRSLEEIIVDRSATTWERSTTPSASGTILNG